MTELFIDNQAILLSTNFSISLIDSNPFFTKNGKTTYDISISLTDLTNVKIYKEYNRPNNKGEIVTGRNARLIVDNQVVLNGTEIILEISDKDVKIQLVSGESELNYFIGGDRRINELDLGPYPGDNIADYNFPVLSKNQTAYNDQDFIVNRFIIYKDTNGSLFTLPPMYYFAYQVKFNVLVKRILERIDYAVSYSFLDQEPFNFIYLVNGNFTSKIAEILPDWTITEFFEELEKLFNCCFIIREDNKTVEIKTKNNFYSDSPKISIEEAIDTYQQKIDDENRTEYSIANIGYDLSDDDYFKYQNLNQEVLEKAGDPIHMGSYESIVSFMNAYSTDKTALKGQIFVADDTNTWYVAWFDGEITYMPKKVNCLRPIKNNTDRKDLDIKLKITPAPIQLVKIPVLNYVGPSPANFNMIAQMPVVDTNYIFSSEDEQSENLDIQEYLENGILPEKTTNDKIQLAFFTGFHLIFAENVTSGPGYLSVNYPVAFVDFLKEDDRTAGPIDPQHPSLSFRLDDQNGFKPFYDQSVKIDTTREYTFKFIYKEKFDVKTIFVIKNKQFVCKELKLNITEIGFDNIIEGIFYPIL
jgi:hypothetical protein